MAAKIARYKKEIVQDFSKLMQEYPIIGVANLTNMPAAQLQKMRKSLRGRVLIRMTKVRLLKHAFAQSKSKGIEQLEPYLKGMPTLLFTKENPFRLYKVLQDSKSAAPAKPGQKAPKNLVIPAGPTPFAPGPVISELGKVGLKIWSSSG